MGEGDLKGCNLAAEHSCKGLGGDFTRLLPGLVGQLVSQSALLLWLILTAPLISDNV
jgi:hypothetical protein